MKNILLIGDSIRMGYDRAVAERLTGLANVYFPDENCRFAQYILRAVNLWKENNNWPTDMDLIHWNAGLWDCIRIFGDEPLSPLPVYRDFIVRVHKRIRQLFPDAKIAFATSTPIDEERFRRDHNGKYERYNREIDAYNAAAVEALTALGESVDDLNAVMKAAPLSEHSDGVHYYTPAGTARISEAVTRFLCDALELPFPAGGATAVGASSPDIGT